MVEPLPTEFQSMLKDLLGDRADELIASLDKEPVISVRLNRRKPGAEFSDNTPVAWCKSGIYLDSRPDFILDPLLHAGAYYVQDASSMIYETVIEKIIEEIRKEHFEILSDHISLSVLDLCAAPGGKTTAMINALPDNAMVTANEYTTKRVAPLKENLTKWGFPNVVVTNKDSSFYSKSGAVFDIIAVDAPCSGEGMMRKDETARKQWTLKLVEQCSVLQRDILRNAVEALKPGGWLIYSTCTFNRMENEENAEFIQSKLGLIPVDLNFPNEWNIHPGIKTELPVYRFMPHVTKGEGLFLAVFRKPGEWEPSYNSRKKIKTETESIIPSYDYPEVEVDKPTALSYLRRESIKLPENAPRGLVTITYKGLPLGPAKNIGSRANNLYPKNQRILKR